MEEAKVIAEFKDPLKGEKFCLALIPVKHLVVTEHQRKPSDFHIKRLKRSMNLLGFTAPVRGLIPEAEWEKSKFKIEEKILPLASTHSTRVSPPPTKPYPTLKFPEAPTVSGALIESVIEPSGSPVLHQKIPVGTVTMPSSKAREHLEKVSPRPISTTRYLFENPSYFAGAFIGEALTAFGIGEALSLIHI